MLLVRVFLNLDISNAFAILSFPLLKVGVSYPTPFFNYCAWLRFRIIAKMSCALLALSPSAGAASACGAGAASACGAGAGVGVAVSVLGVYALLGSPVFWLIPA